MIAMSLGKPPTADPLHQSASRHRVLLDTVAAEVLNNRRLRLLARCPKRWTHQVSTLIGWVFSNRHNRLQLP